MRSRLRLAVASGLCTIAVALPATASDNWKQHQKECLPLFAEPTKSAEARLINCADDFATDAVVDALRGDDQAVIEKALRHLYEKGSDLASKIARLGLQRLGIKLPPRGAGSQMAGERSKYDPPEAKSDAVAAADKLTQEGAGLVKKQKWKDAVAVLVKAVEKNPRSEKALYQLAMAHANLDDKKPCYQYLQHIADLGTDEGARLLIKARSEDLFEAVREETDFKRLTGYVRAQVINTVGDVGDPGVENIVKLFDKLELKKPDKKDDETKPQPYPTVRFKAHAKAQTSVIAELLNDSETRLEPITEGRYDIIIVWGTKVDEKGKPINLGPETADDAIASARKKQNRALAQPEAAINKVNRVLDTPERTINEVGKMKDRVLGVGDKAKGAVDKVKDLEKIGDKTKDAMKIKGL
jgi:hypothetical protein